MCLVPFPQTACEVGLVLLPQTAFKMCLVFFACEMCLVLFPQTAWVTCLVLFLQAAWKMCLVLFPPSACEMCLVLFPQTACVMCLVLFPQSACVMCLILFPQSACAIQRRLRGVVPEPQVAETVQTHGRFLRGICRQCHEDKQSWREGIFLGFFIVRRLRHYLSVPFVVRRLRQEFAHAATWPS